MWCQWGREGEKEQMFLKKEDLTRRKKLNFLLIINILLLGFHSKENFRNVPHRFIHLRKRYVKKAFTYLLYVKKRATTTKNQVAKNGTEFRLFHPILNPRMHCLSRSK